jgi:transcriptional regulator of heat shock response
MPRIVFKPKTKEEIEVEIKRAEEFVKEHPTSIFGTDNVKHLRIFKRICNAYLSGKTLDALQEENDKDEDEEDMEYSEEEEEESMYMDDIINWLRGEMDENFW